MPTKENICNTGDDITYSLTNQRKALGYLHNVMDYATNLKPPNSSALQEVLLASSIYTLTPRTSPQRLNLLLLLASRFDKTIEEIAKLYMAGPAESLLERTWLQAEGLEKAEKQKRKIEFIYAVMMDFYQRLALDNPGLPFPYDLQPYPSLGV